MLRQISRILKKHLLFWLNNSSLRILFVFVVLFVSSFLIVSIWRRTGQGDEDAEELYIDLLKDKIIKLKRSHFLNHRLKQEDFENDSSEQTQNHTLNHRLFNKTSDPDLTSENCRNSVQGKILITDERGYICKRRNLTPGGCCDLNKPIFKRYSCDTCNDSNCCEIIEYCISCCLEPQNKSLLQKVLTQQSALLSVNANRGIQALFASVTDHFELCLAKCRTSSQSVEHENSYKNSRYKHCFGLYNGNEMKQRVDLVVQ